MVVMNIAKRINNRLDHILELRAEMRKMDAEIDDDQILDNITTGEKTNKEGVFELIESQINEIKNELNQITNNGLNVKEIFTNKYYVNDSMQDREIVAEINTKENVVNKKPAKEYHSEEFTQGQFKNGFYEMTEEDWKRAIKNYKQYKKDKLQNDNDEDERIF
jgi:hypothetical protein